MHSSEMPLTWRKSSYSSGGTGDCVEVAPTPRGVAMRDSKNPEGGSITFTLEDWATFILSVKRGKELHS